MRRVFYHGCHRNAWELCKKQGFLLHPDKVIGPDGKPSVLFHPVAKVWLTPDLDIAEAYAKERDGEDGIILSVNYDPYWNPNMNNFTEGGWQFRVYERIPLYDCTVLNKEE